MANGASKISYQLYKDVFRTEVWGNTTADDVQGTGNGSSQNQLVYGQVPAQVTPPPGAYADTIVVTVTY